MTKVYKIVLMVVDHDELGEAGVREVLENQRYPNRCIMPRVMDTETREVEWSDEHPLNNTRTSKDVFGEMFDQ